MFLGKYPRNISMCLTIPLMQLLSKTKKLVTVPCSMLDIYKLKVLSFSLKRTPFQHQEYQVQISSELLLPFLPGFREARVLDVRLRSASCFYGVHHGRERGDPMLTYAQKIMKLFSTKIFH